MLVLFWEVFTRNFNRNCLNSIFGMTKNTKNIFKALKESLMLPIDSAFTIFFSSSSQNHPSYGEFENSINAKIYHNITQSISFHFSYTTKKIQKNLLKADISIIWMLQQHQFLFHWIFTLHLNWQIDKLPACLSAYVLMCF